MPQSDPPIPCFVELPPFERYRGDYLTDKERDIFKALLDQELAKRAKPKGKPTSGKVK